MKVPTGPPLTPIPAGLAGDELVKAINDRLRRIPPPSLASGTAAGQVPTWTGTGWEAGPPDTTPLAASWPGTPGQVGVPYEAPVAASGGTQPYNFALRSGGLPTSLGLGGGGVISGTPSAAGVYAAVVRVTDAAAAIVDVTVGIAIAQGGGAAVISTLSPITATDDTADRWQDPGGSVHAVLSVAIACSAYPQVVSIETTSPQYGRINHGWFLITGATTIKIGLQGTNTNLYPPTTAASETVTVWAAIGAYDSATLLSGVTGAQTTTVSLGGPAAPGSTDATNFYITSSTPTYAAGSGGASLFGWKIQGVLPITSASSGEKFWAMRLCIQTGKYVAGVWTPGGQRPNTPSATDPSTIVGDYAGPTAWYQLQDHADNVVGDPATGAIIWNNPNLWTVPSDGFPIFRFVVFIASRRLGGTWVQENCWSAAAGTSTPGVNPFQELTVDQTKSAITSINIVSASGSIQIDPSTLGVVIQQVIGGVTYFTVLNGISIQMSDTSGGSNSSLGVETGSQARGKLQWDANGKFTKYNNIATVGFGLAPIVYLYDSSGNSGGMAFELLPGGAHANGLYEVSASIAFDITSPGTLAGDLNVQFFSVYGGFFNVTVLNAAFAASSITSGFPTTVIRTDGSFSGGLGGNGIFWSVSPNHALVGCTYRVSIRMKQIA